MIKKAISRLLFLGIVTFGICGLTPFQSWAGKPSTSPQKEQEMTLKNVELFWRYDQNSPWKNATKGKEFLVNNSSTLRVTAQVKNMPYTITTVDNITIEVIVKQAANQKTLTWNPSILKQLDDGGASANIDALFGFPANDNWSESQPMTFIVKVKVGDKTLQQSQILTYSTAE